jgi:hypothetical protein
MKRLGKYEVLREIGRGGFAIVYEARNVELDRTKLRQLLSTHFDEEELRTLCFDLGMSYDDLRGEGVPHKARELVAYLERRGRIPELVTLGKRERPHLDWDVPQLIVPQPAREPRRLPGWAWVGTLALVGALFLVVKFAGITPTAAPEPTVTPQPTVTATHRPTDTPEPTTTRRLTETPEPTTTATRRPTDTPEPTITSTLGAGSTTTREADGMVMVYVLGGEFLMGSEDGDSDEQPVHNVTVDDFWIDRTEVSNAQFAAFLNKQNNRKEGGVKWLDLEDEDCLTEQVEGRYRPKSGYADHPVIKVSWYGARAYCQWVGARLPTEAE